MSSFPIPRIHVSEEELRRRRMMGSAAPDDLPVISGSRMMPPPQMQVEAPPLASPDLPIPTRIPRMGVPPPMETVDAPIIAPRMDATLPDDGTELGLPPIPQDYRERMSVPYEPPVMRDHSTDKPRGVWGSILHRLEHAGKGALRGGLGGAILGAVSPRMVDRGEYYNETLPRYNEDWKMQQGALDAEGENRARLGAITGIDPKTNQPTFPAQKAQEDRELKETIAANTKAINEGRLAETARRNDAYIDKSEFDKQYKLTRLKQFEDGLKARTHKIVKDGKAQYVVDINDPTEAIQVTDKDGNPIADPTAMLEGGRNYRFKEGQAQTNQRQQKQIEATRSNTEYVQGQQNTRQQQDFAHGKYQGKKKRSSLLDDEPTTQAAPPSSGYQVGQVVISNGKRYKITDINPDGSYKAIPQ